MKKSNIENSSFRWKVNKFPFYFSLRLLWGSKPKCVYVYSPNILFFGLYLVCKIRGIELVIEKTELDSIKPLENKKDYVNHILYKLDELISPFFANKLVVISSKLASYYQTKVKKVFKIGAFIPYHALQNIQSQTTNNQDFTIGYFGTFAKKDDTQRLINVFQKLQKQIPSSKLHLVGSVRNVTFKNENIVLFGEIENHQIVSELSKCDVLIAIREKNDYSDYGFPSKFTEYFMTKKPIIASKSSEIPDLFAHKKELILIEPENEKQLLDAIIWVKENTTEARQIGETGFNWAMQHWHPDVVLKKWYDFVISNK
ncbi:MAG: glycosyltransferase [Bacteroidia bacterium]